MRNPTLKPPYKDNDVLNYRRFRNDAVGLDELRNSCNHADQPNDRALWKAQEKVSGLPSRSRQGGTLPPWCPLPRVPPTRRSRDPLAPVSLPSGSTPGMRLLVPLSLASHETLRVLADGEARPGRKNEKTPPPVKGDGARRPDYPVYSAQDGQQFTLPDLNAPDRRAPVLIWLRRQDSNLRHPAYEAGELPGCSTPTNREIETTDVPLSSLILFQDISPIIPLETGSCIRGGSK